MLRVPGNVSVDKKQSHVESGPPNHGVRPQAEAARHTTFLIAKICFASPEISRSTKTKAMRRRRRMWSCRLLRSAGPANRTSSGSLPIRGSSVCLSPPTVLKSDLRT